MEITKLANIENMRDSAVSVYFAAFYDEFKFYHRDIDVLSTRLSDIFDSDRVFVALINGEAVAMLGYSDAAGRSVKPRWGRLIKQFGLFRGTILYFDFLINDGGSLGFLGDRAAFLEGICTKSEFRGCGVASALIAHAETMPDYDELYLKVHKDNAAARRVYERAGFVYVRSRGSKILMRKQIK